MTQKQGFTSPFDKLRVTKNEFISRLYIDAYNAVSMKANAAIEIIPYDRDFDMREGINRREPQQYKP